MSVFLTPDRRPFFGGHLLPPGEAPGQPVVPDGAGRPRRRLGRTAGARWRSRPRSWRRPSAPRSVLGRPVDDSAWVPGGRPRRPRPAGGGDGRPGRPVRRHLGRVRPAPKFPQPTLLELCLRLARASRRPTGLSGWPPPPWTPWPPAASTTTWAEGSPATPPTPSGGPPLREDALRPGRPVARLPARLAGHRAARLPPGGRRGSWPMWRHRPHPTGGALLRRGRRLRGGGGQVLRLDPARSRASAGVRRRRSGGGRRPSRVVRHHRGRELRGLDHPPPAGGRPPGRADRGGDRTGRLFAARGTGASRVWTTRC